ncbi:ParB/RepB/Spo0J family partition protein [Clostridium sp. 19966]|uniref:ParB/RepB/Spo0J family partition protein n=1 Tax=Clostridium sp. 19966 TaxID=2768166 RepID=UPI0028DEF15E|nr:ParB/RepB/Spo0J family partition protein [Clostridium sp. 19966]MDT8719506.1 ParB/RepB/Spo0J family partition protein [Clostridium sp. 19966]
MAVKKHGLGKGLGALIPQEETNEGTSLNLLDINLIKANDEQPRKFFDEEKLSTLASSIKDHGMIQPIVLRKEGDFYVIVAGERRWRAAKLLGIKEVPVIIMDITDKELLEVSLIENIQREDLNPVEEANAYKKLIIDFKLTQEELASRVGKSRTAITNSMRLLNLDSRVQGYLIDGVISEGHGRALLGIEDKDKQYEVAQKIIDEALNVRQTEAYIRSMNVNKIKPKKNANQNDPYIKDLKGKLENYFGTKVELLSKNQDKGKIEIEYYSKDDLNRILELINIDL